MVEKKDILFPGIFLINSKLSCGKSIIELSKFDNLTYWWFVDDEYNEFFNSICNRDKKIQYRWAITEKIMDVIVKIHIYRLINIFLFIYQCVLKITCENIIRNFNKIENDLGRPTILFIGQDRQWRERNNPDGNLEKNDQFFSEIIKNVQIKNNYNMLSVYNVNFKIVNSFSTIISKLLHWNIRHIIFESYYNILFYKKKEAALRHFEKIWELIDKDPIFEHELKKYATDNRNSLKNCIKKFFIEIFPYYVDQIQTAKNLIQQEKPCLLLLLNEYGRFERSLLVAARLQGVPALAIQHGAFSSQTKKYIYQKGEIAEDLSITSPYVQVPERTAVYGEYYKNILTKESSYPENAIVVTGQPRYDNILNFNSLYHKNQFLNKWRIGIDQRIILWTTQCHAISKSENIKNFNIVFNVIKKFKNIKLIIKQHPGESIYHTSLIKMMLLKNDLDVIIVLKTEDTMELIYHSDIIITSNSTTGLEAIALDKPLISINFSGKSNTLTYIEDGVALGATNNEELYNAIYKILTNNIDFALHRHEYIRKHLYKIDGNASERVVGVINELIEMDKDGI